MLQVGSSGFGRLLTEQLLARGDRVAATARRPEALDDLRTTHGGRLWTARLDVTDAGQVREVVADAFAALGRVDVIVSNAGYGALGSVEEVDSGATPLRLTLGSDAYDDVHAALTTRLAELTSQRAVAFSVLKRG